MFMDLIFFFDEKLSIMILDYSYNKNKRIFSISYIKENGLKSLLNFNVSRFKSYAPSPSGEYMNWDGVRCVEKYTDDPGMFDYKVFIKEIDSKYRKLILGRTNPRLYTFDIEVHIEKDIFPEPSEARFPISTISIANDKLDVIILGTEPMDDAGREYIQREFEKYIDSSEFFHTTGLDMPSIQYIYFPSESKMVEYFLKNIVAKVPIIAGWNSIMFDWQYIQNRVKNFLPEISLNSCSVDWTMSYKNYKDFRDNKVRLSIPNHTLVLDMMDVVGTFDMAVMPIKESLSLDYIASESIGMNKIKYDGDLEELFNDNYPKYVFYNAIDSVLVQMIDKKFKTLQNIYAQAIYCEERIGSCFSKIALAEALFFKYFYEHDIKIMPIDKSSVDRGELVGAYVKDPIPGKHNFVCCNDFASLYPSTIITCNLSIENFMGHNFSEEQLEKFRKDPNYFVSVNNNVYKNDKDYAFRVIQQDLKAERAKSKYLAKQLDATVMLDIEHIRKHRLVGGDPYPENIIKAIKDIGYDDIKSPKDLSKTGDLDRFEREMKSYIIFLISNDMGAKLLMNSCYGGSSHPYFAFYNIDLANDITGEARNLIHMMERHIPELFDTQWVNMTDLHKKLGIKLKK